MFYASTDSLMTAVQKLHGRKQLIVASVADMPGGLTATFLRAPVFVYGYGLDQVGMHIEKI